ncbi:hypothetical protein GP5015_1114 [gamma proteobacterium HTCC5015]|nr:hypothetical protein GP5015_1114 [gamma proteobacterium HTCC5015]
MRDIDTARNKKSPSDFRRAFKLGSREWTRTTDPYHVKVVL